MDNKNSEIKKIALIAMGDSHWTGGTQYTMNIINALDKSGCKNTELHIFNSNDNSFCEDTKFKNIRIKNLNINKVLPEWSLKNKIFWYAQRKLLKYIYPRFEQYLIENKYDFIYPIVLSSRKGKLNSAAWFPDFQHHYFPDGAPKKFVEAAVKAVEYISQNANKIVLSSRTIENDILNLYPVSKNRTFVMPFAVYIDPDILDFNDFQKIKNKYNLPDNFFVCANLFAPTKNHETLFKAIGNLKKKGISVNVVCTGHIVDYRDYDFADKIIKMINENNIHNEIILTGVVPRFDLINLFRMSVAMIQPSLNEGWSTSVEEAKALGKDLILSKIPVHIEQYPLNDYFFEPLNSDMLSDTIIKIWNKNEKFPNYEKEKTAYSEYQKSVIDFGNNFLNIAKSKI